MSFENKSIKEVLNDKSLAKLGDSIVNLLYSLVKSKLVGKPDGAKLPDSLLAEAFRRAGLRKYVSARQDANSLGDAAEALVAYSWLKGHFEIKAMVEKLTASVPQGKIINRRAEKELIVQIFTTLLQNIFETVEKI
ncbi:MAG: ribonuclease III family protein [Candidatus Jordarchaeaceae archaeon]